MTRQHVNNAPRIHIPYERRKKLVQQSLVHFSSSAGPRPSSRRAIVVAAVVAHFPLLQMQLGQPGPEQGADHRRRLSPPGLDGLHLIAQEGDEGHVAPSEGLVRPARIDARDDRPVVVTAAAVAIPVVAVTASVDHGQRETGGGIRERHHRGGALGHVLCCQLDAALGEVILGPDRVHDRLLRRIAAQRFRMLEPTLDLLLLARERRARGCRGEDASPHDALRCPHGGRRDVARRGGGRGLDAPREGELPHVPVLARRRNVHEGPSPAQPDLIRTAYVGEELGRRRGRGGGGGEDCSGRSYSSSMTMLRKRRLFPLRREGDRALRYGRPVHSLLLHDLSRHPVDEHDVVRRGAQRDEVMGRDADGRRWRREAAGASTAPPHAAAEAIVREHPRVRRGVHPHDAPFHRTVIYSRLRTQRERSPSHSRFGGGAAAELGKIDAPRKLGEGRSRSSPPANSGEGRA
mmetsp:Transcript_18249/g.43912  ORF Transcript_18249/g.43912 Transcript_18249/m.43912 type:complete len:462 (-) Transcript_18249:1302-2687(-)